MAYNEEFPKDDSYLSDFPAGMREQIKALVNDAVVNALKLQGLIPGNGSGNIPVNNGTENTNLNAALLNGKSSGAFATKEHVHDTATTSSDGFMSNSDKAKLDNIASGAEVNQNAFANVLVNGTTIQADAKQDTLSFVAGTNIAITPDATNDRITIGITGTVSSAASCTGNASTADTATNWSGSYGYINDLATENNADSWIPVVKEGKLQHTTKANMTVGKAGTADSAGSANILSHRGTKTAITNGSRLDWGLSLYSVYNNGYPTSYGNVLDVGGKGDAELLLGWSGSSGAHAPNYIRSRRDYENTWSDWAQIYTSAHPQTSVSGSSGSCTGNANTATTATTSLHVRCDPAANNSVDLVYSQMADSDYFRIRTGGASNAGEVEIATADDGNEPIYVRQYTGVFGTVSRTAALLDGGGNTSFPGRVTSAGYSTLVVKGWDGSTLSIGTV